MTGYNQGYNQGTNPVEPQKTRVNGCLVAILVIIAASLIIFTVVVKVVIPQVTAKFIMSKDNPLMDKKKVSDEQLDLLIKNIDRLDGDKMKTVLADLKDKPVTNTYQTMSYAVDKLGLDIPPRELSNLVKNVKPSELAEFISNGNVDGSGMNWGLGMFKGMARDVLVRIKKERSEQK